MPKPKPIKRDIFLKIVEGYGYFCKRVDGDHFVFDTDPPKSRPVVTVLLPEIPKDDLFGLLSTMEITKSDFLNHELLLSKKQKKSIRNKAKKSPETGTV